MSREWEAKPQMERKYLQKTYLIKDCYPKCTKTSWDSAIRKENGPKTLTDNSPKKIYRWQRSIWKDVPYHMSFGNCKLKQQCDRDVDSGGGCANVGEGSIWEIFFFFMRNICIFLSICCEVKTALKKKKSQKKKKKN